METIVAVATPPGEGALSVTRISGPEAFACAARLFRRMTNDEHGMSNVDTRHSTSEFFVPGKSYHGWLNHPDTSEPVDEVVLVCWRAPHSYTGEDVIELSGHGGRTVTQKILEAILATGVRLAEPGEFTRRAFMNGRMDLVQAEAVADLIRAKTEWAWRTSLQQLQGRWSEQIRLLQDEVTEMLARVEAGIDFVEESVPGFSGPEAVKRCEHALDLIRSWLKDAERGRVAREGVSIVLVGRPNVGKSSVFNALLKADRAIVTPIAGTTRDVIEAEANFHGVWVRLSDTAGMRQALEPIEQLGVQRSEEALGRTDLALWIVDGSASLAPEDVSVRDRLPSGRTIVVVNKSDLPRLVSSAALALENAPVVEVSAKTLDGMEALVSQVVQKVWGSDRQDQEPPFVANLRHLQALQSAERALERAREGFATGLSEEFISVELRTALDQIGGIIGVVTTEDVLGKIFSTFCIGK